MAYEIGRRYGMLTIIDASTPNLKTKRKRWLCKCDCGNTKIVTENNLGTDTKSCGCLRSKSKLHWLVGKRFGRLKVVSFDSFKEIKPGIRKNFWTCKCDCGNEIITSSSNLSSGDTQSCGCISVDRLKKLHEQIKKDPLVIGTQRIKQHYQYSAKKHNREFNLTTSEIESIIYSNCYYCGTMPKQMFDLKRENKQKILYNGIDRLNNDLGYVLRNCVPACFICNRAKGNMTYIDFTEWMMNLLTYQGAKHGI